MKPFNLKEALEGKPVVTRNGDVVTQLYLFDCDDDLPLMGVLNDEIHSFTKDGKWSTYSKDQRDTDLFMAEEKKTIWINIWKNKVGYIFSTTHLREDKADIEIEEQLEHTHLKKITTEL